MRSKDKLHEAQYFLHQLSKTGGKQPEFRYLFSAVVTSCRSISLVLQKDMRRKYGEEFDKWWEISKQNIPDLPIPFEVIRRARNIVEKKGSMLPLIQYAASYDDEYIDEIEVVMDPSSNEHALYSMTVHLRPGHPHFDIEGSENPTDEELDEIGTKLVMMYVEEITKRFIAKPVDRRFVGYRLSEETPAMPFDDVVDGLTEYINAMGDLIEDAEVRFPSDDSESALDG